MCYLENKDLLFEKATENFIKNTSREVLKELQKELDKIEKDYFTNKK